MTLKEQLIQEIEQAPETLLQSCLEFILLNKKLNYSSSQNQTNPTDKPIWEIADEIIATIPEDSFNCLPTDAAANLDYYLYGNSPKE